MENGDPDGVTHRGFVWIPHGLLYFKKLERELLSKSYQIRVKKLEQILPQNERTWVFHQLQCSSTNVHRKGAI